MDFDYAWSLSHHPKQDSTAAWPYFVSRGSQRYGFGIRLLGRQEMCFLIQLHIRRARHKDLLGLWILTESTCQGTSCARVDYQIAKMSTYLPILAQILDNVLHLFNSVYQMQGSQNPSRRHMSSTAFQLQPLTQMWAILACPSTCPEALLLSGHSWDHLASLSSSLSTVT